MTWAVKRRLGAVLASLTLAGCATAPKIDAAADVHAFLASVRDGDRARFEAHVDRAALKSNLRARVMAEAARAAPGGGASVQALGVLLAGPLVDVAADALIRPEVFRAIAELRGYSASRPLPSTLAIAGFIRPLGGGAACVVTRKDGPCLLDFTRQDGIWRLTGFEGDLSLLRPGR